MDIQMTVPLPKSYGADLYIWDRLIKELKKLAPSPYCKGDEQFVPMFLRSTSRKLVDAQAGGLIFRGSPSEE